MMKLNSKLVLIIFSSVFIWSGCSGGNSKSNTTAETSTANGIANDTTTGTANDSTTGTANDPANDTTIDPAIDPVSDTTIDPASDPVSDTTIDPASDPVSDTTIDPVSDTTTDPANQKQEAQQQPTINRDNYEQFLAQAFQVYFGTAYDVRLPTTHIHRVASGDPILVTMAGHQRISTYTCSNGGTVQRSNLHGLAPVISIGYQLENCQYHAEVLNGGVALHGYRDLNYENILLNDFSVTFDDAGVMNVNGGYRRYSGVTGGGYGASPDDFTEHWRADDLDYTFNYSDGSLTVEDATTRASYGFVSAVRKSDETYWNYQAQVEGGFSMLPPFAPQDRVTASTPEPLTEELRVDDAELAGHDFAEAPFEPPSLPRFTSGVLVLEAEDGSSLRLLADTGDRQTAQLSLQHAGEVEEFILNWEQLDTALRLRDKSWEYPGIDLVK